MTLKNCRKRLALAKSEEEKKFWENRISHKLNLPQYENCVKEEVEVKVEVKKEEVEVKKGVKKHGK